MLKDRLEAAVGKGISEICPNRFHNPDENHCAHFVSHMLGISHAFNCKQHAGGGKPGANIRVHEVFPVCPRVGKKADMDLSRTQIVFITLAANVNVAAKTMVNIPQKHVGVYCDGNVYHYGNTADRVTKESLNSFETKFQNLYDGVQGLFFGFIPGEGAGTGLEAAAATSGTGKTFELDKDGDLWFAKLAQSSEPRFLVGKEINKPSAGFFGLFVPGAKYYGPAYRGSDYESRLGHYAYLLEVTGHCESKNRFNLINTYDRAKFTYGSYQLAAHTPRDNLILLMRDLVRQGVATDYYSDLKVIGSQLHHVDENGIVDNLEAEAPTGPGGEMQLQAFMDYLNPRRNELDSEEIMNAARLMHMANEVERARELQVECAANILEPKMSRYGTRYKLDGKGDVLCAIIADIHHQGRASAAKVKDALASGDPERNLIDINPKYEERAKDLRAVLKRLRDEGKLGTKRYQASSNTFV
jgi:hypothetical protein